MTTRRNLLVALGAGALAAPLASFSQQSKVRRIGFLAIRPRPSAANPDAPYAAFVKKMGVALCPEGGTPAAEWRGHRR